MNDSNSKRKPYKSDLTDEQWERIKDQFPPAKTGGRPRHVAVREVVNTLLYQQRTGCQWDMLPHDLLPKSTVFDYYTRWTTEGTWQRILDSLRHAARVQAGHDERPSVVIIDSQSVKGTEVGGDHGIDANKKINGRKRHLLVDCFGFLLAVGVTAANVADSIAGPRLLERLNRDELTRLKRLHADKGYKGKPFAKKVAAQVPGCAVIIGEKPKAEPGFQPIKQRGVVERTNAWNGRDRRHSRDYERGVGSSETRIKLSAIGLLLRRLAPDTDRKDTPFKYRQNTAKLPG